MILSFLRHNGYMAKRKHIKQDTWSEAEKQAFADGVRLRAATIPDKKKVASKKACRRFRRNDG